MTWYTVSFSDPKRATAVQEEIQEAALKLPRVVIDPGFAIFVISRQGTQQ